MSEDYSDLKIRLEKVIKVSILNIVPIKEDVSTRRYSRLFTTRDTYVLCRDKDHQEVLARNVETTQILKKNRIPTPEIVHFGDEEIVLQDLGDIHLLQAYQSDYRFELMERAVSLLCKFHKIEDDSPNPPFTRDFFEMELKLTKGFFVDQFLKNFDEKIWNEVVQVVLDKMLTSDYVMLHRDYQSKNIMLSGESLFIIDHQDMREGPLYYDLCSLVEDPYNSISEDEKMQLYTEFNKSMGITGDRMAYNFTAIQRLFKAMGTYGKVYSERQDTSYLHYAGNAVRSLLRRLDEVSSDKAMESFRRYLLQNAL